MSRLTWEQYALRLAEVAAQRSEDPFLKVGACILRHDHSVASLGYNGAPPGIDIQWANREERRRRVIHAELNALRYVRPGEGELIAVTHNPCSECVKLIAAHRIGRIIFADFYDRDPFAEQLAAEFGIRCERIELDRRSPGG